MSNNNLFLKSGYLNVPLRNGVGRYVCQLMRVTIKFCKHSGSSRGVRNFVEQDLIAWARENPNTVVYMKPRRHRSPVLVAEYLNQDRFWMSLHELTREEVLKWLSLVRTQSGDVAALRLRKNWHTDYPSIQGPWNPFILKNPELNVAELPDVKFGCNNRLPKSATQILKEMFEKQKLNEQSTEEFEKTRAE